MDPAAERVIASFRKAFRENSEGAFREWFLLQEKLRNDGAIALARALADDLWGSSPEIAFAGEGARAAFFHNLGVFFGTAGPAASLERARRCFAIALAVWESEPSSRSRTLHNLANALASLAKTPEDLREALAGYERALEWRTPEREIARGVTRHNMGIAWRRLAAMSPKARGEALRRAAEALREAVEIRERHRLVQGGALSAFHLGLTLRDLEPGAPEGPEILRRAAEMFERLGQSGHAAIAREAAGKRPAQEEGPGMPGEYS